MTLNDGFDRTVSEWLDEQAGRGAPGYLDEVLVRTTRIRQRPAWSSLERWLPVAITFRARLAPMPRPLWFLALLAALALAAALLVLAGVGLVVSAVALVLAFAHVHVEAECAAVELRRTRPHEFQQRVFQP